MRKQVRLLFQSFAMLPLLAAGIASAQTITVEPQSGRPGDTFNLVVSFESCPGSATLGKDSVKVSGSDLTVRTSGINPSNCSNVYPVTISKTPVNRTVTISVYDQTVETGKAPKCLGTQTFQIIDMAAGPIPPGLKPQVDVMWEVMAEKLCSDQFGVRLARSYFCIDVLLGNNSGYPLILAGVGFDRQDGSKEIRAATGSYLSERAVVQREEVLSGRNLTLRTLQAAGALIGGFAGFSGNAGREGRIGLWATVVGGTVANAYAGLVPDRTVKQAGNLDDAALRDGKVVPNNSPVRFTVFVDRQTIVPFLIRDVGDQLAEADVLTAQATQLKARARLATEAEKDKLTKQAQADEREASAIRARVSGISLKASKNKMDFLARSTLPAEKDLLAVRRALGKLIVVGDEIQYLQRVQVDSSAVNPEIQAGPQVSSVSGSLQAGTATTITLLGRYLANATVQAPQCSGLSPLPIPATVDKSGTFITITGLTVPSTCPSPLVFIINNGSGAISFPVTVDPADPAKPAPAK